jgi:putative photosynthetic complex assembly protein
MSHAVHHDPTVPRGALIGVAVVLLCTMAVTGATRLGLIPHTADPTASRAAGNVQAAQVRELHFTDRADGAVVVSDAATGETVKIVGFGQGGFFRATVRRMAKRRIAEGISAEPPFKLTLWDNGALSLSDPQTAIESEIYGFGADHTKVFAEMLQDPIT